ncbi:MAG: 3-deoxy-D-manno-octulosonic acid transferase [Magnetococcales bacterium]|nr:3-deoxy-D-manno-octulosonic acid transferase [Magnetococcales bacterium]
MHTLYHFLLTFVIMLTLPVWIWRYFTTPKYRGTVRQRLGMVAAGLDAIPSAPTRIWLHAVSVGEVMAARELAGQLKKTFPDHPLVVSTVTRTGQQMARERIPEAEACFYLPVDLPVCIQPVVEAIRPCLLVIMETELWPGLFRVLARRGVPIVVVNGRISPRSFRRYHAVRFLTRRLLADGRLYLMQSLRDAERLTAMGALPERVKVTGNLKYDQAMKPPNPQVLTDLTQRLPRPGQPVWIAASTHPGEEAILLAIHRELLAHPLAPRLILVPRHPERTPEIVALATGLGLEAQLFSRTRGQWAGPLLLVDEIGWLAGLYGWGEVVYVGGSLVPHGGQNMLEAAAWRLPVLFGPHVFNFPEIAVQLLESGGAIQVGNGEALRGALMALLTDPERCRIMGQAAHGVIPANAGALERTMTAIQEVMPP